jgi:hypothetical protein
MSSIRNSLAVMVVLTASLFTAVTPRAIVFPASARAASDPPNKPSPTSLRGTARMTMTVQAAGSPSDRLEFNGVTLGMTTDQAIAVLPDLTSGAFRARKGEASEDGFLYCKNCGQRLAFAGKSADYAYFQFHRGKLVRITVEFPSAEFASIAEALTAAHGPPQLAPPGNVSGGTPATGPSYSWSRDPNGLREVMRLETKAGPGNSASGKTVLTLDSPDIGRDEGKRGGPVSNAGGSKGN